MAAKGVACLAEAVGALRLSTSTAKLHPIITRQFTRSMATEAPTTITKTADTTSLMQAYNPGTSLYFHLPNIISTDRKQSLNRPPNNPRLPVLRTNFTRILVRRPSLPAPAQRHPPPSSSLRRRQHPPRHRLHKNPL